MKRLAILLIALTTTFASSGCCGWYWPWGYRGQSHYGTGYGNAGCPNGNCGAGPAQGVQVVPQSGFYQSYDSNHSAQIVAPTAIGTASAAPLNVHRTAMVPLETLSTY